VAFSFSQQHAVVYSLLTQCFTISHSENKQVDVRTGSVAFGVGFFEDRAHKAAAFGSKRRQATAGLLLQQAMRMLGSDDDYSEQGEEA
jgi:hypothetical protein